MGASREQSRRNNGRGVVLPGAGRQKRSWPRAMRSERGVALLIVLILAAVALAIMTAMISMIFSGTQMSGMHKRYKTAAEAAEGGTELFKKLILLRGHTGDTNLFINKLNTFTLNASVATDPACAGTDLQGSTQNAFKAKIMAPSTSWTVQCNNYLTIDPSIPTSYDMKMELGTTMKYTVYAKIADTVEGNTGGDSDLRTKGVVNSNSGDVAVMSMPFLYVIETHAENAANPTERAKLSELYQY